MRVKAVLYVSRSRVPRAPKAMRVYEQLVKALGRDAALTVVGIVDGAHLPRPSAVRRASRAAEIAQTFTGTNTTSLARRHGLPTRTVRKIVTRKRSGFLNL